MFPLGSFRTRRSTDPSESQREVSSPAVPTNPCGFTFQAGKKIKQRGSANITGGTILEILMSLELLKCFPNGHTDVVVTVPNRFLFRLETAHNCSPPCPSSQLNDAKMLLGVKSQQMSNRKKLKEFSLFGLHPGPTQVRANPTCPGKGWMDLLKDLGWRVEGGADEGGQ